MSVRRNTDPADQHHAECPNCQEAFGDERPSLPMIACACPACFPRFAA